MGGIVDLGLLETQPTEAVAHQKFCKNRGGHTANPACHLFHIKIKYKWLTTSKVFTILPFTKKSLPISELVNGKIEMGI